MRAPVPQGDPFDADVDRGGRGGGLEQAEVPSDRAKIDLRYSDFDGLSAVQLKTAACATAHFSLMIIALVTVLAVLLLLLVIIVCICTCASTFPCSCASSFLPFFRFCFGAQTS